VGASPEALPPSFEAFYRRSWRDAVGWAAGLTGDVGAGEEIAQEVFVRAAERFDELENPAGWVRVAVVNAARSWHRARVRRLRREQRSASPDRAHAVGTDELLGSLACLSYGQRAVVVLRYWADWDEATIADALGCRAATVRSRPKRGTVRTDDGGWFFVKLTPGRYHLEATSPRYNRGQSRCDGGQLEVPDSDLDNVLISCR
jgi:RNA polymerase sigma factor (sigma-70 family)